MDGNRLQYKDFAYYYDSLMKDIDYQAWSDYIIQIIEKNGIMDRNVLEMACGTGNIAVNMARRGYNVTAFDLSEDMLAVASSKSADSMVNIRLLRQDMRDIKINEEFGIILCLCDSINYITKDEDLKSIFKWVYGHLKKGGIFIFDINSSYKLRNIIGNNTFTYNEDDLVYIWDNYVNGSDTVEFSLTFLVKEGTLYRRFDELHTERIYEIQEILDMLIGSGFSKIQTFDGFTLNSVSPQSERINFVVHKT